MTVVITLSLPDADAARLQAALATIAPGQTPKQAVIGLLIGIVRSYEQAQATTQYQTNYAPIGPQ